MGSPVVYVIGAKGMAPVKIGVTVNLPERLRTLQTSAPARLAVLWTTPGDRVLERELHARFEAYRTYGEWFDLTPLGNPVEQVERVVEEIVNGAGEDDSWPRTPYTPYDEDLPYYFHPRQATAGRCVCGHQIGSHTERSPRSCGGEIPYGGRLGFNENPCTCPRFQDSPAAWAQAQEENPAYFEGYWRRLEEHDQQQLSRGWTLRYGVPLD